MKYVSAPKSAETIIVIISDQLINEAGDIKFMA